MNIKIMILSFLTLILIQNADRHSSIQAMNNSPQCKEIQIGNQKNITKMLYEWYKPSLLLTIPLDQLAEQPLLLLTSLLINKKVNFKEWPEFSRQFIPLLAPIVQTQPLIKIKNKDDIDLNKINNLKNIFIEHHLIPCTSMISEDPTEWEIHKWQKAYNTLILRAKKEENFRKTMYPYTKSISLENLSKLVEHGKTILKSFLATNDSLFFKNQKTFKKQANPIFF